MGVLVFHALFECAYAYTFKLEQLLYKPLTHLIFFWKTTMFSPVYSRYAREVDAWAGVLLI